VRLVGVGTPERGRWHSIEARKFLAELVEGSEILVTWASRPADRFRHQLAHVWLTDGRFVQAELVRAGLAEAVPIPPKLLYQRCLRSLEGEARAAKVGRWRDRPLEE
jgi:micrococcal nuclease